MHIQNLHLHVGESPAAANAIIAALIPASAELVTPPPAAEAALTPPRIGEVWPGQGGIYAGLARGEAGSADYHLILSPAQPPKKLAWDDAVAWAKTVETDGHAGEFALPTRVESALLYANVRDQLDTENWHWTGTQYSDGNAWNQFFYYGNQDTSGRSFQARCRAVRRLTA